MRYKSPARSSFRDNKTYETLTRSTYSGSTVDRGVDGPNYSDDSTDRYNTDKTGKRSGYGSNEQKRSPSDVPWVKVDPSPQRKTSGEYGVDPQDPSYTYNIIGQTQGVTVI